MHLTIHGAADVATFFPVNKRFPCPSFQLTQRIDMYAKSLRRYARNAGYDIDE